MLRKILKFILSEKRFKKIADESKKWHFVHEKCGLSKSVWDCGGIRFVAISRSNKVFGRCPNCKKMVFFDMIKKT